MLPPIRTLKNEECQIVIGTDGLSSNRNLSIISELRTIGDKFPEMNLEDLIRWATINGAKALGEESVYGCISPGKKPGLILLENADLENLKIMPSTFTRRLI